MILLVGVVMVAFDTTIVATSKEKKVLDRRRCCGARFHDPG